MADFIFRVDSFHLTEEQTKQISAAVQGAVLRELARLDLHVGKNAASAAQAGGASTEAALGAGGGSFAFFPDRWNGGRLLAQISQLQNVAKTVLTVQERQL